MQRRAISPKGVNYCSKVKKIVALPRKAKNDREVLLLPIHCELKVCECLHGGSAVVQVVGKEIIDNNR